MLSVDTWYQHTQGIVILPADKWACTEYQNYKIRIDKHEVMRYEVCRQYTQQTLLSPYGYASIEKLKNAISPNRRNGPSVNPGTSFQNTQNQCGVKL